MNGRQLLDLPPEKQEDIFAFLDNDSILQLHQTSKALYHHLSFWKQQPIPDRQSYLNEHINRAFTVLELSAKTHMNVLLIGNRAIQMRVIARPRYFEDTDFPLELKEDDEYIHEEYKLRFISSLSCDYERNNMLTNISEANIIIVCANSFDDYEQRRRVLELLLDNQKIRPLVFVLKPQNEQFKKIPESELGKLINIESGSSRDLLAKILIERLVELAKNRRNEMAKLDKINLNF